jgi:hypothetical protein
MSEHIINEAAILRTGLLLLSSTFIGVGIGLITTAGIGYFAIGAGFFVTFLISG